MAVRKFNLRSVHREIEKLEKLLRGHRGRVVPEGRKVIDLKLKFLRDLKKKADCKQSWGMWPATKR